MMSDIPELCVGGQYWHTPEHFELPHQIQLNTGGKLWIQGMPGYKVIAQEGQAKAAPIRPFRLFNKEMLPKTLKRQFYLHWQPKFQMMREAPDIRFRNNPSDMDADYLDTTFELETNHLKNRVSYVFQKN